jgi:ABC-type enterochelin transport system permease subunit
MIKEYNRKSLMLGVPGIVMLNVGVIMAASEIAIGPLLLLLGTGLFITGLAYYAKSKGRHPAWCLAGFLSIVGIIILVSLKDRTG